jgi:hypothetical protein
MKLTGLGHKFKNDKCNEYLRILEGKNIFRTPHNSNKWKQKRNNYQMLNLLYLENILISGFTFFQFYTSPW